MNILSINEKPIEEQYQANPNAPFRQSLRSISVESLKSIRNLDDLTFAKSGLTAILGPNGCGKSTILHALACCYQPMRQSRLPNYKFSYFFVPTSDVSWQGSAFSIKYEYDGPAQVLLLEEHYSKRVDRWSPRYDGRPMRDVIFVGIRTCVPRIEDETLTSRIPYTTSPLNGAIHTQVRRKAAGILNFDYTEFNEHAVTGRRRYIGVRNSGVRYSSLSMGAGEQRVFEILMQVFSAPKYALILVDEIDLLLHTDALTRLLAVLAERATDKNLQIIFTTHRESIINSASVQAVRHINNFTQKTVWLSRSTPDAVRRLTGQAEARLELFVEDDVAAAIVRRVAVELGIVRHVKITAVGSADNGFTALGGLILRNQSVQDVRFVLDGDRFFDEPSRVDRTKQVITGDDQRSIARREEALTAVIELASADNACPEQVLRNLVALQPRPDSPEALEIWNIALEVVAVVDRHDFINRIVNVLAMDRVSALGRIVEIASQAEAWMPYVETVRAWLVVKAEALQ